MEHLRQIMGPTLFKAWLVIVAMGVVSWAADLIASALRHQLFFCH